MSSPFNGVLPNTVSRYVPPAGVPNSSRAAAGAVASNAPGVGLAQAPNHDRLEVRFGTAVTPLQKSDVDDATWQQLEALREKLNQVDSGENATLDGVFISSGLTRNTPVYFVFSDRVICLPNLPPSKEHLTINADTLSQWLGTRPLPENTFLCDNGVFVTNEADVEQLDVFARTFDLLKRLERVDQSAAHWNASSVLHKVDPHSHLHYRGMPAGLFEIQREIENLQSSSKRESFPQDALARPTSSILGLHSSIDRQGARKAEYAARKEAFLLAQARFNGPERLKQKIENAKEALLQAAGQDELARKDMLERHLDLQRKAEEALKAALELPDAMEQKAALEKYLKLAQEATLARESIQTRQAELQRKANDLLKAIQFGQAEL